MQEHVTVLPPEAPSRERGMASALPLDLLQQVRGRVRLLALLLFAAFSFDPLLYLVVWLIASVKHIPMSSANIGFRLVDVGAAIASAALWWVSRKESFSAARLLTLGLVYEVAICFVIAFATFWQHYSQRGMLPDLTWVPALVILFPLVLPGPPRRMLGAAILAAATPLLALGLLQLLGIVHTDPGPYVDLILSGSFSVLFAYQGARVIYRLGREVAAARELGSYQLESRLGQGGMGEVWRARHRMLARPAAIKLIRPQSGRDGRGVSSDLMRRFEREAQVIAQLRSPHTVNLFDFGIADNGAFYYAMELLDGLDADTLVRRFGPVSPERTIFLLEQVCHSLSEAESCGLVHRDIKPANIFLCRYGEDYDFVKVLDFGLVKAFQDNHDSEPALTRENMVQGTPAFIAPEQALGRATLDSRVDIYAVGCVGYWLLTGELVFTAENTMGLLLHHIHTQPTRPSARTDLPIPPDLDDVILSCLAKNPADRPQSARELSHRLGEVRGVNNWTQDQARQWWVSHQPIRERSPKEPASV